MCIRRGCITKCVVHLYQDIINAEHPGVSGIALTSMHEGLAAWTFGSDRGLVCTDLITNQMRNRKNATFCFISP
jgi:hypothetical protein